jgi:glycosyltransferase involved in cell wall biosynthesis
MFSLTIVIPSYNRACLLDQTLSSLALQTNKNFMVYLIDNGSKDGTRDVYRKYEDYLHERYFWVEKTSVAPGEIRNIGAQNIDTPLVAFLDSGIVVPSFYVESHIFFHKERNNTIGLGMYHGHKLDSTQNDRWLTILQKITIDEASEVCAHYPELCDERSEINNLDLATGHFPWVCGWSGNMSMSTASYHTSGGFSSEHGYGYEDLDLSYRLFKQGNIFAFVANGWGIHLPHPRLSSEDLLHMDYLGWRYSYWKYRSLALEIARFVIDHLQSRTVCEYFIRLEEVFAIFTRTSQICTQIPSLPHSVADQFPRPSLFIGGKLQDLQFFDYITVANEDHLSTDHIRSCIGIIIPLREQKIQAVVVSDIWKWLTLASEQLSLPFLEHLIAEIKRTAKRAYFINHPMLKPDESVEQAHTNYIINLCNKYMLPFEILSIME